MFGDKNWNEAQLFYLDLASCSERKEAADSCPKLLAKSAIGEPLHHDLPVHSASADCSLYPLQSLPSFTIEPSRSSPTLQPSNDEARRRNRCSPACADSLLPVCGAECTDVVSARSVHQFQKDLSRLYQHRSARKMAHIAAYINIYTIYTFSPTNLQPSGQFGQNSKI